MQAHRNCCFENPTITCTEIYNNKFRNKNWFLFNVRHITALFSIVDTDFGCLNGMSGGQQVVRGKVSASIVTVSSSELAVSPFLKSVISILL